MHELGHVTVQAAAAAIPIIAAVARQHFRTRQSVDALESVVATMGVELDKLRDVVERWSGLS